MVEKLDFTFSPMALPSKEQTEDLFLLPQEHEFFLDSPAGKPPLTINTSLSETRPKAQKLNDFEVERGFMNLLDDSFAHDDIFSAQTMNMLHQSFIPVETINTEPYVPGVAQPLEEKKSNGKKKTGEKKVADKKVEDKKAFEVSQPANPERAWKTVFINKDLVKDGDVSIKIKTRRDKPSEAIPERMYSSLKYVLLQTASGFNPEMKFILSRIKVVDAENFQLVQKNQKDVLKGTIEAALTKPPRSNGNQFEGSLNVQFTDISYHVDKREIRYEISYFAPDNLETPILIKRSAPFKNFARKPNKKRPKGSKRKLEEDEEDDDIVEEQSSKKQKTSSEFDSFVLKLDELVEFNKKLGEEEKRKAMDLIMSKFLQLDPNFIPQTNFLNF